MDASICHLAKSTIFTYGISADPHAKAEPALREMVEGYGRDTMLLIGGGLLSARDALLQRSREFVRKAATM